MSTASLVARIVLAAAFFIAGAAKLVDPERSQSLVALGVPRQIARPAGTILPLLELATAGALLPRSTAWAGAWAAAALLVAFIGGISFNLVRGRAPECHCFGQLHLAPVGKATLLRNLVLFGLAVLLLARGPDQVGPSATAWVSKLTGPAWAGISGGLAAALVLATVARLLVGLMRSHGELLIRLEALEARLAEQGFAIATRDPGRPLGLTVGTGAPRFVGSALDGSRATLEELRVPDLPLLLVFSDPECGPCNALLPQIRDWQRHHADRLAVAVISRGGSQFNRVQAEEYGLANVVLQQDHEIAHAYEVPGTPGAVLVGPSGNVASPVVMGAEQIEKLLTSVVGASAASTQQSNGEPSSPLLRISRVP